VIAETFLKEIDDNEEDPRSPDAGLLAEAQARIAELDTAQVKHFARDIFNAAPPEILNAPMPKRRERGEKPKPPTISLDAAVEEAFDELRELGEEMRNWRKRFWL